MAPPKRHPNKVSKPRAPRKSPSSSASASITALTDAIASSENTSLTPPDMPIEDANGLEPEFPDVDGTPPAWADTRTALGDALPWFRKFQGSMYYKDGLCWGFLIDGDSGIRSHIDDEVIITRIGGGSEKTKDGKLVLMKNQHEDDNNVKYLMNNMQAKLPIGMIIGSKNTTLKRKLPYRYNVMAFFRVAHIWSEKFNGKVAFRVRFEKLDLWQKSWWAEKGTVLPDPQPSTQPEMFQCTSCHVESFRVYKEGWICLNTMCTQFWRLGGVEPATDLSFDESFLKWRSPEDLDIQPHHSLIPDFLSTIDDNDPHFSTLRIAWKGGIVCPLCRKCVSRRFWNGWKCSDNFPGEPSRQCPFEKWLPMHPVSLRAVIGNLELGPIRRALFFDQGSDLLAPEIDDHSFAPYRLLTYRLGDAGYVMHFVANRTINGTKGGPNDLFQELQTADLGLRRYPMSQSQVAGTLTAQFAVNYGLPYKYVVSVASRGFNEACDPILRALGRLTWATKSAVSNVGLATRDPNELLLMGYFEGQRIGYHDDGESSLGPTIATLSLGTPATMSIRMKYKYYHGFTKSNKGEVIADDPVLPNCENYQERQHLKEQLLNGSLSSDAYKAAWLDSYKQVKTRKISPPDIIKMNLNHGDMVVMHGEDVQKYYEHGVELDEESKMRFALTARYIKKDEVPEQDWPKGDFKLSPEQVYNGQ
ncbi:hypothetical protein BDV18DRAFT_2688 [Aspergillus unguis]